MKLFSILLSVVASCNAFTILSGQAKLTRTALGYTVFGGIDEEPEPADQQESAEYNGPTANGEVASLASYRDYDDVLQDEDILGVDSFSHASGASIMDDFHLTALCGDD
jgi:hypothetical protein